MTNAKVLLVIGDGAEVFDTMYPFYRIPEDGYKVIVAGPEKRDYHLSLHDHQQDWDITVEKPGITLPADIAFKNIIPDEYIAIVLSGGRAPEYLRYDNDLINIIKDFNQKRKLIASVCHGIEILATADIIRSRKVTCVPKCQFDVEVCGGIWLDQPVVVDGNLVTARVAQDNTEWMREFMKKLKEALVK